MVPPAFLFDEGNSEMKKILCAVGAFVAASALTTAATAGDLKAGKAKVKGACQTCHGTDGVATMAMTPNLFGQQKEYLIIQLEQFRAGKRRHEQMTIIAKMLSDDDIENVAEWYSSIKVTLELPE